MDRILTFLKREKIVPENSNQTNINFYKANPIDENTDGYKGRIGIHESLKVTATIKDLIIKNATSDEIEEQAKKEGMLTMIEDGIFQAVQGLTSIEEVLRVAND